MNAYLAKGLNRFFIKKTIVGAFNKERALIKGAFSGHCENFSKGPLPALVTSWSHTQTQLRAAASVRPMVGVGGSLATQPPAQDPASTPPNVASIHPRA